MRAVLGVSSVIVLALAAAGCGSDGPENDHDAILSLWQDLFVAFEAGDTDKVVGLYSSDCEGIESTFNAIFRGSAPVRDRLDYEVSDVSIRDLTGEEADSAPVGRIIFEGGEQQMDSDVYTPVIKQDGRWVFRDCAVITGLPLDEQQP